LGVTCSDTDHVGRNATVIDYDESDANSIRDSVQFEVLMFGCWALPSSILLTKSQENSIVLKLTCGVTGFLLTSDAEDEQEASLVNGYGAGDSVAPGTTSTLAER
jgi:beta-lactamase superfamily II metal-dependent hydrolase